MSEATTKKKTWEDTLQTHHNKSRTGTIKEKGFFMAAMQNTRMRLHTQMYQRGAATYARQEVTN